MMLNIQSMPHHRLTGQRALHAHTEITGRCCSGYTAATRVQQKECDRRDADYTITSRLCLTID
jgi:hypothetical protein